MAMAVHRHQRRCVLPWQFLRKCESFAPAFLLQSEGLQSDYLQMVNSALIGCHFLKRCSDFFAAVAADGGDVSVSENPES